MPRSRPAHSSSTRPTSTILPHPSKAGRRSLAAWLKCAHSFHVALARYSWIFRPEISHKAECDTLLASAGMRPRLCKSSQLSSTFCLAPFSRPHNASLCDTTNYYSGHYRQMLTESNCLNECVGITYDCSAMVMRQSIRSGHVAVIY